eukprot:364369-Chlamydomonas_euryale.AAC.8
MRPGWCVRPERRGHRILPTLYTGNSRHNSFHIFCRHITKNKKKSQSLQRAPLTRPPPGSTAQPGYRVAREEKLHNISHSRHGERKKCHTSDLLGLLKFQRNKVLYSVLPGLPVQGTFRRRSSISSQGINLVWPGNLRKSRNWCHYRNLPHGIPGLQSCTSQKSL